MLLVYVVVALITLGFVLPCVIDVAMTPRHDFGLPTKQTWLLVVGAFWVFGAIAWLVVGRRDVRMRQLWFDPPGGRSYWADQAQRRHPSSGLALDPDFALADATGGRVTGLRPVAFVAPDDNPEFLLELDRRIREWREGA